MVYIFLFLSTLGFLDSTFLTTQHYSRDPLSCPLFGGCDEVTTSAYSEILGIPVALLGVLYYGLIFLASLYSYLSENKKVLQLAGYFTIVGLLCSLYFVFLMLFVLNALCFYCLVSALSSTLLFSAFVVNWLSCRRSRQISMNSPKENAKS